MTEEKQASERLGTPDTGAHDKMHGDKLKSAGVPPQPGTARGNQDKPEAEVPDDQAGGGV